MYASALQKDNLEFSFYNNIQISWLSMNYISASFSLVILDEMSLLLSQHINMPWKDILKSFSSKKKKKKNEILSIIQIVIKTKSGESISVNN